MTKLKLLSLLTLTTLLASQSFAQDMCGIQNEANKTLANIAGTATKLATDKKGRLILGGANGAAAGAIPVSSGTLLGGFATGNVGWNSIGGQTATTGSTSSVIAITGIESTAVVGDMLQVAPNSTTTALRRQWAVITVVATNAVTVSPAFSTPPVSGDTFFLGRPVPIFASSTSGFNGNALEVNVDYLHQANTSQGILKIEDAVASTGDSGVPIFGELQSALSVDAASGDYGRLKLGLDGRLITAPAPAGETFQSCGTATAVTSDVAIKASVASNRIYVTSIQCKNTSSTTGSNMDFKDGSTIIAVGSIGEFTIAAAGNAANYFALTFPVPLRGTSATAFNFATNTEVSSVTCCAQGYISVN